jgi:N,N-dimethylformamidase
MDANASGESLELTGYADHLSIAPGEHIRFMIHSEGTDYRAGIVRLTRGDVHPEGPGLKETPIESPVSGEYPGQKQTTHTGSFVAVSHHETLEPESFTITLCVYPTLPEAEETQGLLAKWDAAQKRGYALVLEPGGRLAFTVGTGPDRIARVVLDQPLRRWSWYAVAAVCDSGAGELRLYRWPLQPWPDDTLDVATSATKVGAGKPGGPLLIGAVSPHDAQTPVSGEGVFNGKISQSALWSKALTQDELQAVSNVPGKLITEEAVIAAWDFSRNPSSQTIFDGSGNGHHGLAMNMPMRAVTGPNWTGDEVDFLLVPEQYGAIHFHDDDLEDARWSTSIEWDVPADLPSGVYALRTQVDSTIDRIPFFVRPPRDRATAPVLFLAATFTYLAYANERLVEEEREKLRERPVFELDPRDVLLASRPEYGLSCYDTHRDGSGCCYTSRLRPIGNLRPDYRWWPNGTAIRLGADLSIVDWLDELGYQYDVATDEDLHHDGQALLERYRVVITGTHPEYMSGVMMDAFREYLNAGGHLMYLGGNGFYWVTSVDRERPHVLEIRRGINGTRTWNNAPGEGRHSSTGEPGGLWRYRGKSPNAITGVGFTAQGFEFPTPGYVRLPESFDDRAAWIFEGIGPDEVIGDFGLVMGGATGYEFDRLDHALGSPQHALRVATSEGRHSDALQLVVEDLLTTQPGQGGAEQPLVRADMVLVEWPKNGAVFSEGSINWAGSLCWNGYDNNVSRVTRNVLDNFLNRPGGPAAGSR